MSLASTLLGEGFRLPIARRGIFSQDDFFSGFRNDYGRAVGDVLDRWGSRSSKADRFASYRRLRERDPSEDSQAATISEKPEVYVIVLDMNEYASGEITVETVGLSAVVEGKVGQRRYHRRFPLPQNTIIDGVVADMSDENILTVTAPRKGKGVGISVDSREDSAKAEKRSTSTSTASATSTQESGVDVASIEAQIIPTEVETSQTTSTSTIQERVIPTVMEGSAKSTASQSVKTEEIESSTRRGSKSRVIPLNIEGEKTTSETMVSEGASSATQTVTRQTSRTSERVVPTVLESGASDATQESTQATSSTTTSVRSRVLPIKRRGRFFQDSTFERVWDDFESVMDDLVSRRGSRAGMEKDRFQSYRNLRQCVQQDDNQAWNVTKDNGEYKIVVDVKEFVDDHLDVKAQQGAIVVTGKRGKCSFERRFSIPGLSQPDKVAAALSADGVLTITAPK